MFSETNRRNYPKRHSKTSYRKIRSTISPVRLFSEEDENNSPRIEGRKKDPATRHKKRHSRRGRGEEPIFTSIKNTRSKEKEDKLSLPKTELSSSQYREQLNQVKHELSGRQQDLIKLQQELSKTKHKAATKEEKLRKDYNKTQNHIQGQKEKLDDLKIKLAECKIDFRKKEEKYKEELSLYKNRENLVHLENKNLVVEAQNIKDELKTIRKENLELNKINQRQSKNRLHEMVSNLSDRLEQTTIKLKEKENLIKKLESEILELNEQKTIFTERNNDLELKVVQLGGRHKQLKNDVTSTKQYIDNMKTQIHVQMEQKKLIESHNIQLQEQIKVLLNSPQIQQLHNQLHKLGKDYTKLQTENSLISTHCSKIQEINQALGLENEKIKHQINIYLQEEHNQANLISTVEEQKHLISNLATQVKKQDITYTEKETQTPDYVHCSSQLRVVDYKNFKLIFQDYQAVQHFIISTLRSLNINEEYFSLPFANILDEDYLHFVNDFQIKEVQQYLTAFKESLRHLREELTERIACDVGIGDACLTQ